MVGNSKGTERATVERMSPFVFCSSCPVSVFEATAVIIFSYILLEILHTYICVEYYSDLAFSILIYLSIFK